MSWDFLLDMSVKIPASTGRSGKKMNLNFRFSGFGTAADGFGGRPELCAPAHQDSRLEIALQKNMLTAHFTP
jgi:hypothetical protein